MLEIVVFVSDYTIAQHLLLKHTVRKIKLWMRHARPANRHILSQVRQQQLATPLHTLDMQRSDLVNSL